MMQRKHLILVTNQAGLIYDSIAIPSQATMHKRQQRQHAMQYSTIRKTGRRQTDLSFLIVSIS